MASAPEVLNDLASSDLAEIAITDPDRVRFLLKNLGDQINAGRMAVSPPLQCVDLSDHIADVIIETSAQGASLLEVHIIDPEWMLFRRDASGNCFIDVDPSGLLWPPIEVNFPADTTDAVWRLAQCRPSTDVSQANVILTFEDRIVAEMREYSGPVVSNPNETRAEFISRLVREVRLGTKLPAVAVSGVEYTPIVGPPDGSIRFVPLLKIGSPSAFTAADLASGTNEVSLPASARQPNASPARKNYKKTPKVGGGHPNPLLRDTTTSISIATSNAMSDPFSPGI